MPAKKRGKVTLTCPHCGHEQQEPATAYSTTCKGCRQHLRVQELLKPAPRPKTSPRESRRLTCFACGTALEVPASAQSTMCKRCSAHVDLADYEINGSVSKNFRTKGSLVVASNGFLFNTETTASHVILKGRFIGKLIAEQTLEIHPGAQVKGNLQAGHLIIPAQTCLSSKQTIVVGTADIAGELAANLQSSQSVHLRASARMFGHVQSSRLIVEAGAVFVGSAKVRPPPPSDSPR